MTYPGVQLFVERKGETEVKKERKIKLDISFRTTMKHLLPRAVKHICNQILQQLNRNIFTNRTSTVPSLRLFREITI